MQVRLLRDWAGVHHPFYPAGAVVTVDPPTARQLLHAGQAEPVFRAVELAAMESPRTAARPKAKHRKAR